MSSIATKNLRPLATIVEQVWGKPEHEYYYSRAYFNWMHLLYMLDPQHDNFNESKSKQLNSTISETQQTSVRLLFEWWSGAIQDGKLIDDMRHNIVTAAMAPLMDDAELAIARPEEAESIRQIAKDNCLPFNPRFEESSYHEALFKLWRSEFLVIDGMEDLVLDGVRRWASIAACNQRVAWFSFNDALNGSKIFNYSESQESRKFTPPKRTSLTVCPWLGLQDKKGRQTASEGLPYYLWDLKNKCTVEVSTFIGRGERPNYHAVSHTWGRWRTEEPPVSLSGVPWDVPRNSRFDIQSLINSWEHQAPWAEYMWFDLLCIPQETKDSKLLRIRDSEIARQGEIFGNSINAIIWLDDVTSWSGLEVAVLWFAVTFLKQSRSQSKAGTSALDPLVQLFENEAEKTESGLYEQYKHIDTDSIKSAELSGWFSSLWTLQEACLCPHALFANRHWRLFAVGPKNVMITLDNLIALVLGFEIHRESMRVLTVTLPAEDIEESNRTGKIVCDTSGHKMQEILSIADNLPGKDEFMLPKMPRAASELHRILNDTELTQMLEEATPTTILALANQRYCKHSRAQAIMSVVGATAWFEKHLRENGCAPPECNLVLGTFPLEFVREVQGQLGALFFMSARSGFEQCPTEVFYKDNEGGLAIKPVGSMLPFSSSRKRPKKIQISSFKRTATRHPSTRSWRVLGDGSVEITEAAIFASFRPDFGDTQTEHTKLSHLKARIIIHSCEGDYLPKDEALSHFLRVYSPEFNIYAVILTYGPLSRNYSGIFLQEAVISGGYSEPRIQNVLSTLQGWDLSTKVLVRVGSWTLWDYAVTTDADLPPVRDVCWRVL